jgi:hypothetical protein
VRAMAPLRSASAPPTQAPARVQVQQLQRHFKLHEHFRRLRIQLEGHVGQLRPQAHSAPQEQGSGPNDADGLERRVSRVEREILCSGIALAESQIEWMGNPTNHAAHNASLNRQWEAFDTLSIRISHLLDMFRLGGS